MGDQWEVLLYLCLVGQSLRKVVLTEKPAGSAIQNNASLLPTLPKAGASCSQFTTQNGFFHY